MSDPRYQQLFHYADHVTPYLKGELLLGEQVQAPQGDDWLFSDHNNQELLQDIYAKLQLSHPEAGACVLVKPYVDAAYLAAGIREFY